MARESDSQAVANMITDAIDMAEEKYDHLSLSSSEVTRFIREEFEWRYNRWQGIEQIRKLGLKTEVNCYQIVI